MAQINESMVEGLKKLGTQAASLMMVPDADVEFLTNLQLMIRDRVLASAAQAASGQLNQATSSLGGGAPMSGMGTPAPPMMPGASPMPPPGIAPGGVSGGGMGGIPAPNPDELRRILAGG